MGGVYKNFLKNFLWHGCPLRSARHLKCQMFVLGLVLPFEVFGFVFDDGRRVFLPLSTLGRRAAGGPCREDGFDDDFVKERCLRADEAAPGRD